MKELFLTYVNAVNKGDIDAAMALIAPDAQLINSKYRSAVPAEGFALLKAYIAETVTSQNGHIRVLDLKENGGVVEAAIELRSDRITGAGFSRIVGTERFTIEDHKIKGFEFAMNLTDPETKQFFDFVRNLEANRPR